MLNKVYLSLLLIACVLVLTACGTGKNDVTHDEINTALKVNDQSNTKPAPDNREMTYEIVKSSYMDQNIKINYPRIMNLNDSSKQEIINETTKNEAQKVLQYYKDDLDNLTLEIDYEIKWMSASLLSIQYIGSGYVKDGAYPNNIFYTTNIDIHNGKKLRLKDFVYIDEGFIEKLKNGNYKAYDPDINVESQAVDILNQYTDDDLIGYLNKADDMDIENGLNAFSYFTEDSLGISFGVAHAIGDHAEFEIGYQDLIDNMNPENEIWKDFLDVLSDGIS